MFTIQNKNRTISVVIILAMVLSLAPVNPARAATLTQSVTTIAGNGLATFSGDGGPATAAALNSPPGVAVAADGTVYVADSGNLRIRRISPGGVISTIAGNGTYGDSGDDGQATAAQLGGVGAIALSPADDILYISDSDANRVRQVDLGSGVISTFAGRGLDYIGHEGNGGPATDAWIGIPLGIAVDPAGNVYFTEFMYCTVRKVDIATHIITRVAGSGLVGDCASDGDGGDALAARLSSPNNVATDAAGNLFLIETATDTVRRIDAGTHIITTVAGGGVTTPGFGAATTMDLGEIEGLAIDDADNLYVSNFSQVFKVDLGTGILSVFAGTGVPGFSGDGGPAQDATFSNIWGLDVRGDALFIADTNNNRIRTVVPPPLPDDLIIELATSQALLDSLTAVPGSILMINVDGREYLLIPNATSVGLDVTLTGNDQLIIVDLGALQSAGGSITISGNLVMQSIDLSSLDTVDGSLTVTGNPALNAILISGVTSIGGDLTVIGTAATVIDISALTTVTGSINISGNTSATVIDMGGLTTASGDLVLSDNTAATAIDMSSLTTTGGDLVLSGNTSATAIDMSSLTTTGGDLVLSGNTAETAIDMSSLTTTGGDLVLSDNTAATAIDMSSLTTTGGDLIVVDNGAAMVDMSAGTDVAGDLTVETTGTGPFPMGTGTVAGDLTLDATGYTDMSGTTPGGSLDLTATNFEAVMHLQIQAASFTAPVTFQVNRLDPIGLVPESGVDAGGGPATIDPVAAYQFDFAVPTLDRDASLSFDIVLAQLAAATRTALLDALAAGNVTMVTKGDAAGSAFQAFPICAGAQTSTADGCVRIETFDALGQPTTGTPAIIRFSNVVGHFSTWAVAIVTPMPQADLSVTKSDSADPVTVGEEFRYTVVVTNNGPDAAENVILNDTLPTDASFNFVTINQGTCAIGFPTLQCQLGTINAGGSVTLNVTVTPNAGGTITNTVSITSDTDDPDTGNNSDSEETVVTQLNTVPTVSVVSGYCFSNVLASGMVYLSLSDADENPLSLTFDSNTNPTLIPNGSIMVAGKENIRAISLMAKFMKSGTATLTFNLSDGTVTIPFIITVKVGTARNETLNGTEGADMIFGLNGKDIINGFGGNDLLCGGNGIDTIGGGDGNDFIDGQNGDDLLTGGNDNDILLGRFGNDVLTGGSGFDFFSGGAGVDTATDFNAGEGDTQNGTIP